MAPAIPLQQAATTAVSVVFVAAAFAIYARVLTRLRAAGGQVQCHWFDLPDVLVSIVLASTFGGLVVRAALRHTEAVEMRPGDVLPSALFFAAFLAGLAWFLSFRGLRLLEVFGIRRVSFASVGGWAALLLLAAFPFVGVANAISVLLLKDEAAQQPLVELFRKAAQSGDLSTMGMIAVAGVIVAPLSEEFLFRGYFYGVGKRYAGPWLSALLTAALFAAFHASLTAFAGLFVLALALTVAYERTGSLAVPVTMHALFNATSLGLLYLQVTHRLPI